MKKALFWTTVIFVPGGSLLLVAFLAKRSNFVRRVSNRLLKVRNV
jgi:hypothetical protein